MKNSSRSGVGWGGFRVFAHQSTPCSSPNVEEALARVHRPFRREVGIDLRASARGQQHERAVVGPRGRGAAQDAEVVRHIEQRVQRAGDDAIEVHVQHPLAQPVGKVRPEKHQPAQALRLPASPCRDTHRLEVARRPDDLDALDRDVLVREADDANRPADVPPNHVGPDGDGPGLVVDAELLPPIPGRDDGQAHR
jgi:hypothetical protein